MTAACLASAKLVVGVPAYNEGKYIGETLRSLADQDHDDFKVLISDNASDDATAEICEAFARSDNRFIYVRQARNIGAMANFRFCLEASSSEYFIWCGAHDALSSNFLSAMSSLLDRDQSAAIAFGTRVAVDEDSRTIEAMREDDKYIYRFPGGGYSRYLQAACSLSDCVVVNGLIRRKWLDGIEIKAVTSGDKVIICHLLYFGCLRYDFSAEYRRRYFENRTTTAEERILGDNARAGMSQRDLVEYFVSDFAAIQGSRGHGTSHWRILLLEKLVSARFLHRSGRVVYSLARLLAQPRNVLSKLALDWPGRKVAG